MATLVDSSLWIHQLRKSGDPGKRDRVNALLTGGEAAWCPPVRLELWHGVTNDAERKTLRLYQSVLTEYEVSADVWEHAIRLADRGRAVGMTLPLGDLLVFACAKIHKVELAHDDVHFEQLLALD